MRKVLTVLLVLLMLTVSVSAKATYVTDHDRLLTSAETQNLEESFSQYHTEYGFTVALLTVDDLEGEDPADYASQYYKTAGYDNDGVMLLLSEHDGQWYVYTSGVCVEVITDEMLEKLGTIIKEDLDNGNYYDACKTFTKRCTGPVCEHINSFAVSNETIKRENRVFVFLGLGGGLLMGIAAVLSLAILLKKPFQKK